MVCLVYGRPYAAHRDMLRGGEMFTLAMFSLMGIYPKPFTDVMDVSVTELLRHVATSKLP